MVHKKLRIYIAGKVSADSSFRASNWREGFCRQLSDLTGFDIYNLDPLGKMPGFELKENDPKFIFGRDCFMIRQADLVLVYLSDDISVGGSQEMLIAKHFKKPLIGLVKQNGKFSGDKIINGVLYKNWKHPFVVVPCDTIVNNIEQLAEYLKDHRSQKSKDLTIIDKAMDYYYENFYSRDKFMHFASNHYGEFNAHKALIADQSKQKLLVIKYADHSGVAKKVRGKFGLPGGKSGFKEDGKQTLTRRVKEETGVVAHSMSPFYSWSWQYKRNKVRYTIKALAHIAQYQGGALREPYRRDEIDMERAYWISLKDININNFVSDEQPIIKQFLANI